jgi:hypothetical protein
VQVRRTTHHSGLAGGSVPSVVTTRRQRKRQQGLILPSLRNFRPQNFLISARESVTTHHRSRSGACAWITRYQRSRSGAFHKAWQETTPLKKNKKITSLLNPRLVAYTGSHPFFDSGNREKNKVKGGKGIPLRGEKNHKKKIARSVI